jgi:hypothetical protein
VSLDVEKNQFRFLSCRTLSKAPFHEIILQQTPKNDKLNDQVAGTDVPGKRIFEWLIFTIEVEAKSHSYPCRRLAHGRECGDSQISQAK